MFPRPQARESNNVRSTLLQNSERERAYATEFGTTFLGSEARFASWSTLVVYSMHICARCGFPNFGNPRGLCDDCEEEIRLQQKQQAMHTDVVKCNGCGADVTVVLKPGQQVIQDTVYCPRLHEVKRCEAASFRYNGVRNMWYGLQSLPTFSTRRMFKLSINTNHGSNASNAS